MGRVGPKKDRLSLVFFDRFFFHGHGWTPGDPEGGRSVPPVCEDVCHSGVSAGAAGYAGEPKLYRLLDFSVPKILVDPAQTTFFLV